MCHEWDINGTYMAHAYLLIGHLMPPPAAAAAGSTNRCLHSMETIDHSDGSDLHFAISHSRLMTLIEISLGEANLEDGLNQ
jgi:hypothetical protein